ncbi:MAG: hypothetical protein QM791_13985 [Ferruginibacter sp.]
MIAYNKEWLDNNEIQEQLDDAFKTGCITKTEKEGAAAIYKSGFYSPNFFIRIGMYVLTVVIAVFSCGLAGIFFLSSGSEAAFSILLTLCGAGCYLMLELMIKNNHHYRSGVDDALIMMAPIFIISAINIAGNISFITNAFIVFVFAMFAVIRYADKLMAFIMTAALLYFIFLFLSQLGTMAKALAPFVLMIASAVIYFVSKKLAANQAYKYYKGCFTVMSVTVLVSLYTAGNYFVVRETSNLLFNLELAPEESISYGWVFWVFTISIPFVYIVWGVIKKDIVLIRTGLLLSVFVVLTVRFYYAVLPAELAMILAGVILVALAYLLTQFLREAKFGFTSAQQAGENEDGLRNIEAIIIAETLTPAQQPQQRFGGGNFGGGGASGDF